MTQARKTHRDKGMLTQAGRIDREIKGDVTQAGETNREIKGV